MSLVSAAGVAAPPQTALMVQAEVPPRCQVDTRPLDFGVYVGRPQLAEAQIQVRCDAGLPFRVALDAGARVMAAENGAEAVFPYQVRLADGPAIRAVGSGAPQWFKVLGRIPANLDLPPGAYRDWISITVSF